MADIPQELKDAATYGTAMYNRGYEEGLKAGKRAGMDEQKRHQDFVTATAYECGHKAGMERAAEIAEADNELCDCHARSEGECACGAWWGSKQVSPLSIAQAIRSEIDGHG